MNKLDWHVGDKGPSRMIRRPLSIQEQTLKAIQSSIRRLNVLTLCLYYDLKELTMENTTKREGVSHLWGEIHPESTKQKRIGKDWHVFTHPWIVYLLYLSLITHIIMYSIMMHSSWENKHSTRLWVYWQHCLPQSCWLDEVLHFAYILYTCCGVMF